MNGQNAIDFIKTAFEIKIYRWGMYRKKVQDE